MNLSEIYSGNLAISYEVFPPKNDDDGEKLISLYSDLEILKKYNPSLISITYGAGGSNKTQSLDMISHIKNNLQLNVMPHFTCICSKKEDIQNYLSQIEKLNIKNILALRGDEPQDITVCYRDFRYANELISFIKSETNLSIAVAGYPEAHIDSPDLDTDIKYLSQKLSAGGEVIFTQMCFDIDKFFSYYEKLQKLNISVPIAFGVLPILSFNQFTKMMTMAKVSVPKKLLESIYKYQDNSDDIKKLSVDFMSELCKKLISSKTVSGLHFYTLNKSLLTSKILDNLNL